VLSCSFFQIGGVFYILGFRFSPSLRGSPLAHSMFSAFQLCFEPPLLSCFSFSPVFLEEATTLLDALSFCSCSLLSAPLHTPANLSFTAPCVDIRPYRALNPHHNPSYITICQPRRSTSFFPSDLNCLLLLSIPIMCVQCNSFLYTRGPDSFSPLLTGVFFFPCPC